MYNWVHKIHHLSTSPNLLTNLSVNPLELLINGGFVPLFLTVVTVHEPAMGADHADQCADGLYDPFGL